MFQESNQKIHSLAEQMFGVSVQIKVRCTPLCEKIDRIIKELREWDQFEPDKKEAKYACIQEKCEELVRDFRRNNIMKMQGVRKEFFHVLTQYNGRLPDSDYLLNFDTAAIGLSLISQDISVQNAIGALMPFLQSLAMVQGSMPLYRYDERARDTDYLGHHGVRDGAWHSTYRF